MKNKKVFAIIVISVVILVGISIGGYFLLMDTIFSKPEIYLYQPNKPLTINLSEGVQFMVEGSSKRGVAYIEFQENGRVIDRKYPPEGGAESLLTHISWTPRNVGLYELSLIAYDQGGMVSDPAKVAIGVISDGLTAEEVNRTEKAIAESQPSHVVLPVSGGSGSGEIGDAAESEGESIDGAPGGGGGEDEGEELFNDDHGWGEGIEDGDRPLENDLPPEITSFDIRIERIDNNVNFSIFVTAEDDHGVNEIYFGAFSNAFDNGRIEVYQDCGGVSPCNFSKNMMLKGDASYDIVAAAVDTIGQNSAVSYQHFTVGLDPNEPPAIAIESPGEEIIPIDLYGLILMENGVFQMQPFSGAEWFGSENVDIDEPEDACAPSRMDEIRIEVGQEYHGNEIPFVDFNCYYPCNLQTAAEDTFFCVQIEEIGTCNPSGGRTICPARLVFMAEQSYQDHPQFQMYGEGFSSESILCGRGSVTLSPVAMVEGEVVETGTAYQLETLPCPPPPPDFYQLRTTTTCSNINDWCLVGDIGRRPRFDESFEHLPVDHYVAIERITRGDYYEENEIIISAENPYYYNGNPIIAATYDVEIYSVSPEGIRSFSKRINIRAGTLEVNPERESRDWQESR